LSRIANDHNFDCDCLSNKTIENFSALYLDSNEQDILMIVIKLKEIDLYQRFFLDAGIGFWEEMNKEDAFYDFSDCKERDLAKEFNLIDKKINTIKCQGSSETFSSMKFNISNTHLLFKFKENNDSESDIILRIV